MKKFTLLTLILSLSFSSVLYAQIVDIQIPAKKNVHHLCIEAFAFNYSFHHLMFKEKANIGFGVMGGFGLRFPVSTTQFVMSFGESEGVETFDAFKASYIEFLKFQLSIGYSLGKHILLDVGPFVSSGYFGDMTNTFNYGIEGSLIFSFRKLLVGARVQTGNYQIGGGKYSFSPIFVTPTIGVKF